MSWPSIDELVTGRIERFELFTHLLHRLAAEIRGVGNYAIELRWHDGHSTGIYTYDYLRSLCPCSSCSAERTRGE